MKKEKLNNDLIDKLTKLEITKKAYTRLINVSYYDKKKRKMLFNELKNITKEIEKTKTQLKILKEIRK